MAQARYCVLCSGWSEGRSKTFSDKMYTESSDSFSSSSAAVTTKSTHKTRLNFYIPGVSRGLLEGLPGWLSLHMSDLQTTCLWTHLPVTSICWFPLLPKALCYASYLLFLIFVHVIYRVCFSMRTSACAEYTRTPTRTNSQNICISIKNPQLFPDSVCSCSCHSLHGHNCLFPYLDLYHFQLDVASYLKVQSTVNSFDLLSKLPKIQWSVLTSALYFLITVSYTLSL